MKGFVRAIEDAALGNNHFRTVLYTAKHSQIVAMSLPPGTDIGEETHADSDQYFRIELGKCTVKIDDNTYTACEGDGILVPAGAKHNIINTSDNEPLKLYTIYSPPHHRDGVVHLRKSNALEDDETFDGKTTE